MNPDPTQPLPPPEYYWKWRGKRWRTFIIVFGGIALIGSQVIGYATSSYIWGSVFINLLLIGVGVFAFKTEREWPLKKRILWLCELPVIYYFLQYIPFGMITGLLRLPIGNDVICAMMLALLTLRRSTWFVEPNGEVEPEPEKNKSTRSLNSESA